jgi:hypothetical protein
MQNGNPSGGEWPVWSDTVCPDGDRLVVLATEPMDWPMREFCRVPIFFRDRKYYCRAKTKAEPPHSMRYELWPWPADDPETSAQAVFYDEAYVEARNRHARGDRRGHLIHLALLPLYPVLGLCWSGFKEKTLGPVGFEPSSITIASVALLFNLCVLEIIFVRFLFGGLIMWTAGDEGLRWVDWLVFWVCSADCLVRYSGSLCSGSEYHLGFYEWLWPRRAR